VIIALVIGCAAAAGVLPGLATLALVTLPLLLSILLINTFLFPGATDVITRIGPLAPTWSGLSFAVAIGLRLLAISLAIGLAYLTTATDDLLADLERRRVGRRAVFVVGAALQTVPRTLTRAGEIIDSQRARGLDTEGRPWRRVRGLGPLVGPVILGALSEVEEQTMALEARAFSARGRRTLLRVPPDDGAQRVARYALVLAVVALAVATRAGVLRLP
jgi:energy-coupling factor transport system permease protein